MFWIGFLIGLPVGGTVGVLTLLLFQGAARQEES